MRDEDNPEEYSGGEDYDQEDADNDVDDDQEGDSAATSGQKRKKKPHGKQKKKRKVISFLDTEAQEDDDEEDEDDERGVEGLFDDQDEFANERVEASRAARQLDLINDSQGGSHRLHGGQSHLESAIGALERRFQNEEGGEADEDEEYGGGLYEDYEYEGAGGGELGDGSDLVGRRVLPPSSGFRMFKVDLSRQGKGREVCIEILKRYAELPDAKRQYFGIGSAYCNDSLKTAIYVEAMSVAHVIEGLRNIRYLMLSRAHISLVPFKEMASAFASTEKSRPQMPRIGEWVRFAKGLYQGDLALVADVDMHSMSVVVRVVPRLDLSHEYAQYVREQKGFTVPPVKLKVRPQKRLISKADIMQHDLPIEVGTYPDTFKVLRNVVEEATGYLMKSVRISQLITGDAVSPTESEIREFSADRDLRQMLGIEVSTGTQHVLTTATKTQNFSAGQRVWISVGDLAGLKCTVVHQDNENSILYVDSDDKTLLNIQVPIDHVVKRFDNGDSVRVVGGPYDGEVGLVIKVDVKKQVAYVLSTESQNQITCGLENLVAVPNDVMINQSGLTKLQGFAVNDLVQVSSTLDVGIVLKIGRTKQLEVLTTDGVKKFDMSELAPLNRLKLSHELDCQLQMFGIDSAVEILAGCMKGKTGRVVHIWKGSVFVQVPGVVTDGGFVVCKACELRAAAISEGDTSGFQASRPSQGGSFGRGGMGVGRGMGAKFRIALMGQAVKILGGPYKGLLGELRNIQGADATVLVTSVGKEVNIKRQNVQLMSDSPPATLRKLFGGGDHNSSWGGDRSRGPPRDGGGSRFHRNNNNNEAGSTNHRFSRDNNRSRGDSRRGGSSSGGGGFHSREPDSGGGWGDSSSGWGDSSSGWGDNASKTNDEWGGSITGWNKASSGTSARGDEGSSSSWGDSTTANNPSDDWTSASASSNHLTSATNDSWQPDSSDW